MLVSKGELFIQKSNGTGLSADAQESHFRSSRVRQEVQKWTVVMKMSQQVSPYLLPTFKDEGWHGLFIFLVRKLKLQVYALLVIPLCSHFSLLPPAKVAPDCRWQGCTALFRVLFSYCCLLFRLSWSEPFPQLPLKLSTPPEGHAFFPFF